ncbi:MULTISPECIES: 3-oxoacid CoA-transferase subunit B [Acetobacterium]|jgi:3-oxoacid CoA-transferase subunit B/acetate CoA/acetoacetate CoA-transferase beta subunit|uniref:3-oxoacid CoA-transferase subunit B n=1 Tax=Acetobacterium TaxID=33951 RepID=UPI002ACAED62|nr:3-oxoacid CoA-transferase subunit B [Acetobacterium sp. K1/6]MDZ5726053.1 3-oxoacid CoA-transferase subunit B [Acetobacterium sp. K1/6]
MSRDYIAKRIAKEFKNGMYVNLGIGIPTESANYIPEGTQVFLQTENGGLMFGPKPKRGESNPDIANAGAEPITMLPGGAVFDVATSFAMIRGGHIDMTVVGALEVDELGSIASWKIPGKLLTGMGGAMDLLYGCKRVVVAMMHTDKHGNSKIRKKCTLPLTAAGVVDMIITDKAVFRVAEEGLYLEELAPGVTASEVEQLTEATILNIMQWEHVLIT